MRPLPAERSRALSCKGQNIVDAGRGACGAGFNSPLYRYAQHCDIRTATAHNVQPRIDRYGEGGNGDKEPPVYGYFPYTGGFYLVFLQLVNDDPLQ